MTDGIGFGLEKFDAIGRRRDKQKITFLPTRADRMRAATSVELPIDATGKVAGLQNSDFSSPKELGRILAESRPCQECMVKQLFRYANGRRETPGDKGAIEQAYQSFQTSGFHFQELVVSLCRAGSVPTPTEPRPSGSGF